MNTLGAIAAILWAISVSGSVDPPCHVRFASYTSIESLTFENDLYSKIEILSPRERGLFLTRAAEESTEALYSSYYLEYLESKPEVHEYSLSSGSRDLIESTAAKEGGFVQVVDAGLVRVVFSYLAGKTDSKKTKVCFAITPTIELKTPLYIHITN